MSNLDDATLLAAACMIMADIPRPLYTEKILGGRFGGPRDRGRGGALGLDEGPMSFRDNPGFRGGSHTGQMFGGPIGGEELWNRGFRDQDSGGRAFPRRGRGFGGGSGFRGDHSFRGGTDFGDESGFYDDRSTGPCYSDRPHTGRSFQTGKRPFSDASPYDDLQQPTYQGHPLAKRQNTGVVLGARSGGLVEEGISKYANGPFALVIPVNEISQDDTNPAVIFTYNVQFEKEYFMKSKGTKKQGGVTVSLFGTGLGRPILLGVVQSTKGKKDATNKLHSVVGKHLLENCKLVKPNPYYFNGGRVPEFLRRGIPCDQIPPLYKVLTKDVTGPLTPTVCDMILTDFLFEPFEDLFFHDSHYNAMEQETCRGLVKKVRRKVQGVHIKSRRYRDPGGPVFLCIYKKRSGIDIFNEVKYRRNGYHPKYIICERSGPIQTIDDLEI